MNFYQLIYTDEELTRELQDFRKAHARYKTRQTAQIVNARVAMLAVLLAQISLTVWQWNFYRLLKFATNWALCFQTMSIALSLMCSIDTKIESKKGILALHHFIFEVTCPLNLIVVVFYWGLLHAETMQMDEF